MITILKFDLLKPGISSIQMHSGAEVLSAGLEGDHVVLWAKCHDQNPLVDRKFLIALTGQKFPIEPEAGGCKFVCTLVVRRQTEKGLMEAIIHLFDLGQGSSIILP